MSKAVDYINVAIVGDFERGYYVSKEDAIKAVEFERKEMLDKVCKLLCDICYFSKSAHSSTDACRACKAEGGDYYRFTKLAEK